MCRGHDSHITVGGFLQSNLISYDLTQVMELENIVANTVYLKARESEYRVRFSEKMALSAATESLCVVVVPSSTSSRTRTVVSPRDTVYGFI